MLFNLLSKREGWRGKESGGGLLPVHSGNKGVILGQQKCSIQNKGVILKIKVLHQKIMVLYSQNKGLIFENKSVIIIKVLYLKTRSYIENKGVTPENEGVTLRI